MPCRYTPHDFIWFDIFCNDGAGSDNGAVAYFYTAEYHGIYRNQHIITYYYRFSFLRHK